MKLSEKIYRIRKARGYSQEQFGALLGDTATGGISRQSVSAWEKGENEPTLDNLRDIAKVLDISFDALLDETVDLDDDKTMLAVLHGGRVDYQNDTKSRFAYDIRPYGVKPKHYVFVAIYSALFVFAVVTLPFVFISKDLISAWFFVSLVAWVLVLGICPILIECIKVLVTGNPGFSVARMDESEILIHAQGQARNTIYLPLEKIESIELYGKQHRLHGSIAIFVKNREKPVVLSDIYKPKEFIDIFGKLDSYIESSDGIKIL